MVIIDVENIEGENWCLVIVDIEFEVKIFYQVYRELDLVNGIIWYLFFKQNYFYYEYEYWCFFYCLFKDI